MTGDPQFEFKPDAASRANVSLSQAILAPLDAIFKAQVHAARSFLNLLLQIGYPHQTGPKPTSSPSGATPSEQKEIRIEDRKPYSMEFLHETVVEEKRQQQKISVPALSLVPLAPLAVQSGEFSFDLNVQAVTRHRQMQQAMEEQIKTEEGENARFRRPWFLVDDPISVRGTFAPPQPSDNEAAPAAEAKIHLKVRVERTSMPAGLDKLLTSLTQTGGVAKVTQDDESV